MEAVKLAPTLVPAAVLAAKFESEAHQVRRAMRLIEAAWLAQPHPDLADAYSHVKLGDSARQRLVRVDTLAAKMPGHIEGALAVARAAIDASEFSRAREALVPFIERPTQRVAVLMAEIERTEHGDSGRARAWAMRAVRALHDPAWTADGYVSERWRPVSPVSGKLDAFQWQTPVASLPSDKGGTIESSPFEDAMLAAPPPKRIEAESKGLAEPPRDDVVVPITPAAQDNAPVTSPPAAARPPNRSRLPQRSKLRHRQRPNRPRPSPRPCFAPARTSQKRFRRSSPSSAPRTTPGSTTRRRPTNLSSKSARQKHKPAAGAVSCPAGAAK